MGCLFKSALKNVVYTVLVVLPSAISKIANPSPIWDSFMMSRIILF